MKSDRFGDPSREMAEDPARVATNAACLYNVLVRTHRHIRDPHPDAWYCQGCPAEYQPVNPFGRFYVWLEAKKFRRQLG
jgi:hypothetical protein